MAVQDVRSLDSARTRRAFSVGKATLDFPSISAQSNQDLTITVKGASVDDAVILGIPNASALAGVVYNAFVSAVDTVTVRACNYTAAGKDPASGVFSAIVVR